MKKLFENIGKNVFKLKEISFGPNGSLPPSDPNADRFKELPPIDPDSLPEPSKSSSLSDLAKQIMNLRMKTPPKGKELRRERYLRIASNVSYDELDKMRDWISDTLYKDVVELGKEDTLEDIKEEVKKLKPWEVVKTIDSMYTETGRDGLAKWKTDHNSDWEL